MTAKPNADTNTDVFTFSVVLHGVEENMKQLENKLFDAGCDDASLASRDGRIALEFDREAESLSSAVGSAIDDIQAAGYRIAAIRMRDQATGDLAAELSAWQAASDEGFGSFESRLE